MSLVPENAKVSGVLLLTATFMIKHELDWTKDLSMGPADAKRFIMDIYLKFSCFAGQHKGFDDEEFVALLGNTFCCSKMIDSAEGMCTIKFMEVKKKDKEK